MCSKSSESGWATTLWNVHWNRSGNRAKKGLPVMFAAFSFAGVSVRGPAAALEGEGSAGDQFLGLHGLAFRVGAFLGCVTLGVSHEPFKLGAALRATVFKEGHRRLREKPHRTRAPIEEVSRAGAPGIEPGTSVPKTDVLPITPCPNQGFVAHPSQTGSHWLLHRRACVAV